MIEGTLCLKDEGSFHELNPDGTPRDYVSFNSWKWPQGVSLYGLSRLWDLIRREDLLATLSPGFIGRLRRVYRRSM
ncbi:MAG: hypothetical protein ACR5LD_07920 [Symbiopectobacterium sp.]